jgi:hypothetical protein
VNGILAYDRAYPGKVLIITGLSTDQFYSGFADRPFETFGVQNVFIAPGGARDVDDQRGWVPQHELTPETVKALLNAGKAEVLDVSYHQIRDVTGKFALPSAAN